MPVDETQYTSADQCLPYGLPAESYSYDVAAGQDAINPASFMSTENLSAQPPAHMTAASQTSAQKNVTDFNSWESNLDSIFPSQSQAQLLDNMSMPNIYFRDYDHSWPLPNIDHLQTGWLDIYHEEPVQWADVDATQGDLPQG